MELYLNEGELKSRLVLSQEIKNKRKKEKERTFCGCKKQRCSYRCGCVKKGMECTIYCICKGQCNRPLPENITGNICIV